MNRPSRQKPIRVMPRCLHSPTAREDGAETAIRCWTPMVAALETILFLALATFFFLDFFTFFSTGRPASLAALTARKGRC